MYFTTEGILGIPLGVSASFIFLIHPLRSLSGKDGHRQTFIDVADAIAGWAAGGPERKIKSAAIETVYP